ncbi:MAG: methyl-accepting chemotaxis protein [Defluviitaleaceae bacterium]|nr:methyl-accepting chemotaxis protein [Defluviitaleaceae bacterium]
MRWFIDLSIRAKLTLSFAMVIMMVLALFAYSFISMRRIDGVYTHTLEYTINAETTLLRIHVEVMEMMGATALMSTYTVDAVAAATAVIDISDVLDVADLRIVEYYQDASAALYRAVEYLREYLDSITSDPNISHNDLYIHLTGANQLWNYLDRYRNEVLIPLRIEALNAQRSATLEILDEGAAVIAGVGQTIDDLVRHAGGIAHSSSHNATTTSNQSIILLAVIAIAIVALAMFLSWFVSSVVSKPIKKLANVADDVASGKLAVNIFTSGKDEVGMLGGSLARVVKNVNTLITDITALQHKHAEGNIHHRIDEDGYEGAYREVVAGVNQMSYESTNTLDDILNVLEHLANGNLDVKLKDYPGEKQEVNRQMDNVQANIHRIVFEINRLAHDGANGQLTTRVNAEVFNGVWKQIMEGLNQVMNSVAEPVQEVQNALNDIAKGNFDTGLNGVYHGAFDDMKKAMNGTVSAISSYIQEITEVLKYMADGDLTKTINRDYIGQFDAIKDAINGISSNLRKTMADILTASEQVNIGSRQISDSSASLAVGAGEQSSAIERLSDSVDAISIQTQNNADNADNANVLAARSTSSAISGNESMQNMLIAMEKIQTSSTGIQQIISVISDIAFQTNLLALNAAVEAARAGEHGRGFNVVAEEVRNLASKSQQSVHNTESLINDSNAQVGAGAEITQTTADALQLIVDNAAELSNIISAIADASKGQAEALAEFKLGIDQIAQVVSTNTTASEESAVAAEELMTQAEALQNMMKYFKI